MEYNTVRPQMVIPEYGRNIQKMVEFALSVSDRTERNKVAQAIVNVMGQLNPHLRDVTDFKHKLWDHLFIISNYQLDVDSPYPKPTPEVINEKPKRMAYPQDRIMFKHYGKVLENMIKAAVSFEEGEEKNALIKIIANSMKKSYLTWNRDTIEDDIIIKDLERLSEGKLKLPVDFQLIASSEVVPKTNNNNHRRRRKNGGKPNFKKKKY